MAGFRDEGHKNSRQAGRLAAARLLGTALPARLVESCLSLWRLGATGLVVVLVGNVRRAALRRSNSLAWTEGECGGVDVRPKMEPSASSVCDKKQRRSQEPWARGERLCAAATWLESWSPV